VSDDCSLYLILEGKVDIFLNNRSGKEKRNGEDYVISELNRGKHFGEFAFFSGYQRQAGAKAASYCTLAKLKREDFM
jgi:CRP-like cAMP-binding protein